MTICRVLVRQRLHAAYRTRGKPALRDDTRIMEASAALANDEGRLSRTTAWRSVPEAPWLAIVLALLAGLPFMVTRYPQLTDYPAHLARYHVMLAIGHNAWLQKYYIFQWRLTGNLGVDLLMVPLGHLLGVETAGWLVGLVIPPLTGLGIFAVEWTLRRRVGVGSLLALTPIWPPAMVLGFYNFCLGLALALFAFALWVRWTGRSWRAPAFLAIGLVVWLCHVSAWGILGIMAFGYEWSRRKHWRAILAPWPLLLPVVPMALFPGASSGALPYGPVYWLYKQAIFEQAMRDQWFELDELTPLLLLAPIVAAMIFRRFDGRLGWSAVLMFLAVWAVPRHLGGGDYADYRLIPVALMLGSLAIDWRAPRWALWLAPLLFVVRLAATTQAWIVNDRELTIELKALDFIPEGARVAGAVGIDQSTWPLKPYEHAPGYATVRRDALVNTHFAIPGVHMLQLRAPTDGPPLQDFVDPWHRILYKRGQDVHLAVFAPAYDADYLWYFGGKQPSDLPEGAIVLYRTPHSLLARLAKPPFGR
jgi:hypothetical protein